MATSSEIMSAAEARIAELQATERATAQQIDAIRRKALDQGSLSDADRATRDDLRATQQATLEAIEEVSLVNMQALDDADEVKNIRERISQVIADLEHTRAKILRIGEIADKVGSVVTGLKDLADKLPQLTAGASG
jgi:X-X-X-Leu-X-X-Gly heptad repeat protein